MEIDAAQKDIIQTEFIEAIKKAGLVLVPKSVADVSIDIMAERQLAMRKKTITPYIIAKLKLIPGVTNLKTVKNMVQDGRISASEHYTDTTGKMYVLTSAIKRLRNE